MPAEAVDEADMATHLGDVRWNGIEVGADDEPGLVPGGTHQGLDLPHAQPGAGEDDVRTHDDEPALEPDEQGRPGTRIRKSLVRQGDRLDVGGRDPGGDGDTLADATDLRPVRLEPHMMRRERFRDPAVHPAVVPDTGHLLEAPDVRGHAGDGLDERIMAQRIALLAPDVPADGADAHAARMPDGARHPGVVVPAASCRRGAASATRCPSRACVPYYQRMMRLLLPILLLFGAFTGCGTDPRRQDPVETGTTGTTTTQQAPARPTGDDIGYPRVPEPPRPPGARDRGLPAGLYRALRSASSRGIGLARTLDATSPDERVQRSARVCAPLEREVRRTARHATARKTRRATGRARDMSGFAEAVYVHCFARTDLVIDLVALDECNEALLGREAPMTGGRECLSRTVVDLGAQASLLLEAAAGLDEEDAVARLRPACELLIEEREKAIDALHDLETLAQQMIDAARSGDEHGEEVVFDQTLALADAIGATGMPSRTLLARHCRP